MDRIAPLDNMKSGILTYSVGDSMNMEEMKQKLVQMGYERNFQIESAGQFAVRGGILDIFPLTEEVPYRIELWGDEIDSIRSFEVESQRSIENLEEVRIYPACEVVLSAEQIAQGLEKIEQETERLSETFRKEMKTEEAYRVRKTVDALKEEVTELGRVGNLDSYFGYFLEETVSFLNYFPEEDTILFLDEPARIAEKGRVVEQEFSESMKHRLEKGYILPVSYTHLTLPTT